MLEILLALLALVVAPFQFLGEVVLQPEYSTVAATDNDTVSDRDEMLANIHAGLFSSAPVHYDCPPPKVEGGDTPAAQTGQKPPTHVKCGPTTYHPLGSS